MNEREELREVEWPGSEILLNSNGNAFAILGNTRQALRRAGASGEYVESLITHVTRKGDYDHLLGHAAMALDGEWDPSHDHGREE